jgi:hypothetical protein
VIALSTPNKTAPAPGQMTSPTRLDTYRQCSTDP